MGVDVKHAVQAAIDYVQNFGSLFPNQAGLRLEETEYDGAHDEWQITLSFLENQITGIRTAKLFRIDATNGMVKSMKNRISR
jgi:hypothetical protein